MAFLIVARLIGPKRALIVFTVGAPLLIGYLIVSGGR